MTLSVPNARKEFQWFGENDPDVEDGCVVHAWKLAADRRIPGSANLTKLPEDKVILVLFEVLFVCKTEFN